MAIENNKLYGSVSADCSDTSSSCVFAINNIGCYYNTGGPNQKPSLFTFDVKEF